MKSFILGIIALIALSTASVAQNSAIQQAVIQTPGVQVEACKTRIENFLPHEYGVAYVKADFRRHTVTVKWFKERTNIENIKTALANMGYDADDVTADPDAYKRLPAACKPTVVKKDIPKPKE